MSTGNSSFRKPRLRFGSSSSGSTCGCQLFGYEESERALLYLMAATPDGGAHPGHPPDKESHIYMRSKAEWDRTADELMKYETTSLDEIITGLQKVEILNRDPSNRKWL